MYSVVCTPTMSDLSQWTCTVELGLIPYCIEQVNINSTLCDSKAVAEIGIILCSIELILLHFDRLHTTLFIHNVSIYKVLNFSSMLVFLDC